MSTRSSSCGNWVRDAVIDELNARELGRLQAQIKFSSYSLAEMPHRRLWNDLMDDDIGQSGAWGKYTDHVARRNVVVHEGGSVEAADASDSTEGLTP